MEIYNPAEWHEFFVMIGHGSAVLAGLVFVAMELDAVLLFKDGTHRGRAVGTISGFMSVFIVCAFALMGHQTHVSLGAAWVIAAAAGLGMYARGFFRSSKTSGQSGLGVTPLRTTLGVVGYLGQMLGAAMMIAGNSAGVYIAAGTMALNMIYLVSDAWLLFIGVVIADKKIKK